MPYLPKQLGGLDGIRTMPGPEPSGPCIGDSPTVAQTLDPRCVYLKRKLVRSTAKLGFQISLFRDSDRETKIGVA